LGAILEKIHTTPDFRRRIVRRGAEAVVVDLVRERARQGPLPKERVGNIKIDPPQEILANKLCTLLSRSELRDLIDVYALEQAGFRVEDALPLAQEKDGGLTAAQLAWVLSQIDLSGLPEGKIVLVEGYGLPRVVPEPEGAVDKTPSRRELLSYLADLSKRLRGRAMPVG
jgi:Nucleotidyl transferase AbiEii toxin, Type IV TA system